jgi:hypothetical protein
VQRREQNRDRTEALPIPGLRARFLYGRGSECSERRVKSSMVKNLGEEHLRRVRRICFGMPETMEKLSHGAPTFFARGKRVFAMFVNNHHNDGHVAVWIPAAPGLQAMLIRTSPKTYFKPPYVGVRGWIGIELDGIDDEELAMHISESWRLVAPKAKTLRRGV